MNATNTSPNPVCPQCGFRVLNRRYPKCESCGIELPEPLVYSAAERAALMAKEDLEARQRRKARDGRSTGAGGDSGSDWWNLGGWTSSDDAGCGSSDGGCGGDGGGE